MRFHKDRNPKPLTFQMIDDRELHVALSVVSTSRFCLHIDNILIWYTSRPTPVIVDSPSLRTFATPLISSTDHPTDVAFYCTEMVLDFGEHLRILELQRPRTVTDVENWVTVTSLHGDYCGLLGEFNNGLCGKADLWFFFNPFSCEIQKIANFEWNYTLEPLNCSVYKLRTSLNPKISLSNYPGNFYKLDF